MLNVKIFSIFQGINFDPQNYHIRCLAHIVNLACQSSLKPLKNIAPAVGTELAQDELEDLDEDVESPRKDLSAYSRVRLKIASLFSRLLSFLYIW